MSAVCLSHKWSDAEQGSGESDESGGGGDGGGGGDALQRKVRKGFEEPLVSKRQFFKQQLVEDNMKWNALINMVSTPCFYGHKRTSCSEPHLVFFHPPAPTSSPRRINPCRTSSGEAACRHASGSQGQAAGGFSAEAEGSPPETKGQGDARREDGVPQQQLRDGRH